MMKKREIITAVMVGILLFTSMGIAVVHGCPATNPYHFYLDVNPIIGETYDVTTCYYKDNTSDMYVESEDMGYGDAIEIRAIGRKSPGLSYSDFEDCSGGIIYYMYPDSDPISVCNWVKESKCSYAGLMGRDTTDGHSRVEGHFHTDSY